MTNDQLESTIDQIGMSPTKTFYDSTSDLSVDGVEEPPSARDVLQPSVLIFHGVVQRDPRFERLEGRGERVE